MYVQGLASSGQLSRIGTPHQRAAYVGRLLAAPKFACLAALSISSSHSKFLCTAIEILYSHELPLSFPWNVCTFDIGDPGRHMTSSLLVPPSVLHILANGQLWSDIVGRLHATTLRVREVGADEVNHPPALHQSKQDAG